MNTYDANLSRSLRECAKAENNALNPHWESVARMLMMWAADALEAAEIAIDELENEKKTN